MRDISNGGLFINIEGIDGAGKTTLIKELANIITTKGYDLITSREPGGTDFAEQLRAVFKHNDTANVSHTAQALLVTAARRDHVERLIMPSLAKGKIVLTDRFATTTRMYQRNVEDLERLIEYGTAGLMPDINICLDIEYDTYTKRIIENLENGKFDQARVDHLDLIDKAEFQDRKHVLQRLQDSVVGGPHYMVDANGTPEETLASVLKLLNGKLMLDL